MIMAGGTGGHVFPGLAVAEALTAENFAVVWLGTRQGIEARVVPEHGIAMHWISITGVRGKHLSKWITAPFKIAFAILQALLAFKRCRPAVVLGMGGFVAGPGGIAAWLARKPLLIHEQNAVAGTTNRLLARFAQRIFTGFPASFPRASAETIGNPVRESIAKLGVKRSLDFSDRGVRLLVLGGSQGAQILNRLVPEALARLDPAARPAVRHQAGKSSDLALAAYSRCGVEAAVESFIDDMAEAYAWADIVIARSGALTVSELAAAGLGAILVPLPHAIDDHQAKNAEQFAAAGAGVVLHEAGLDASALAAVLVEHLSSPDKLRAMSRAALMQAKPNAARDLARACIEQMEAAR
jgi:UDP-N-acetylglucosamine--N-acetylmuramyl-(pentapeptide) pyrophosphoryl-undecaprenol N-acetylglucosamine transferase